MATFKVGDVVELKSGSPNMTISKCYGDNTYQCEWFNEKNEVKSYCFDGDMLEIFIPDGLD